MLALRFGSYSIVATLPGILSLFLLKSITRYFLLLPPPTCLTVMRPVLLRPPDLFSGVNSDFSGVLVVISSNVNTVILRRPLVVALYFLTAIRLTSFNFHLFVKLRRLQFYRRLLI